MGAIDAATWESVLLWASLLSLAGLAGAALVLPWLVSRLPVDYFTNPHRRSWREITPYLGLNLILLLLKNCLGLALILLGFVMLFTPGQGLLSLLAGLVLCNFPGKFYLERRLVSSPGVLKAINWMRQRRGQAAMRAPTIDAQP